MLVLQYCGPYGHMTYEGMLMMQYSGPYVTC